MLSLQYTGDRRLQGAITRTPTSSPHWNRSTNGSPAASARRNRHLAVADVPHLLPDLDARFHEMGQPERADHQSARPARLSKELRKWKFSVITGVNTLFSGLLHTPGFEKLDFSPRSRSSSAAVQRYKKPSPSAGARSRGLRHRSLRTHRNLARRLLRAAWRPLDSTIGLPVSSTEVQYPQRGFRRTAAMGWAVRHRALHRRRDLRTRPAGDEGLLEQPGRNGTHLAGRLAERPATSATWTSMVTCASPIARKT